MDLKSKDRLLFNLFLMAFAIVFILLSLEYNETARRFPFYFGWFVLILSMLQMISDLYPKTGWIKFMRQKGLSDQYNVKQQDDNQVKKQEAKEEAWPQIFKIYAAIVLFVIVMKYVHFFISAPVFVFLFTWLAGKESWKTSVSLAVCTGVFLYILFGLILGARF